MNASPEIDRCFSCGGEFQVIEGPVHPYMKSTPGCWAAFGEVLAREYSNLDFFNVHRLTVDSYAAQHPGSTDRQSIQSVGVHLIRLCLFLERGLTAEKANSAMLEAGKKKHTFTWLEPPANQGAITVADVLQASSVAEHTATVRSWARCVWKAWSPHHETIRAWLPGACSSGS